MHFSFFSLACLAGAAWAQEPICDSECQKGCDDECQGAIRSAFEGESALWVSDIASDPFYTTPTDAEGAVPGDLLRWEDVPAEQLTSNWTIPASLSLSRFMYMTEDIDNRTLPATAWVLLPFHNTLPTPDEPGKLRTVVWTHGTAGSSRVCSTTNHKGLYYDWAAPFSLAEAGYAVIAPDYSGLGSDIPQGFMYEAGFLHAADVAYAVVAARKEIGDILSEKWAVFGHSEGGMTAWRTNERLALAGEERLLEAGEFVGAVAASPALRPQRLIPLGWEETGTGGAPFTVYFLQSLARLYPDEISLEDYLGETVLQRLGALDNACLQTGSAAVGALSPEDTFSDASWLEHPATNDWAVRYNGQGPHPLAAPMLVIQGVADTLTPASLTMEDFNLTCEAYPESSAHAKLYPGMAHNQVLEAGRADIVHWLDARFRGEGLEGGCVVEEIEPLGEQYSQGQFTWNANVILS